jgi:DNA-binding GntR family transcriptional regulator
LLIAIGYVPERLITGLKKSSLSRKALVTCLHEIGARPAAGEQLLSATGADEFAARHLKVEMNAPLLQTRLLVRDSQGRVVTHEETLCRPERLEFRTQMAVR